MDLLHERVLINICDCGDDEEHSFISMEKEEEEGRTW